jgi:hypothetical protein
MPAFTAQPNLDIVNHGLNCFDPLARPRDIEPLTKEVRQATAVELRLQGLDYDAIGRLLGMERSAVRDLVEQAREAYRAQIKENTHEMIEQEGARLDLLQAQWFDKAHNQGDPAAAKILLDIHGARVRLFGLAAPDKIQMEPIVLLPPSMSMPTEGAGLQEVHADAPA